MAEQPGPVLIIGATGIFGKRLARHLSRTDGLRLVLTSRRVAKAQALVDQLIGEGATARLAAVALDYTDGLRQRLQELRPFAVVEVSGPFHGAVYDTARAAIECGAHFIDLADARDYLAGFRDELDETASTNGVAAIAGASSTPPLSGCVVDTLPAGWQRVDHIDLAISPAGRSEVGRAVIEAIMSYAG